MWEKWSFRKNCRDQRRRGKQNRRPPHWLTRPIIWLLRIWNLNPPYNTIPKPVATTTDKLKPLSGPVALSTSVRFYVHISNISFHGETYESHLYFFVVVYSSLPLSEIVFFHILRIYMTVLPLGVVVWMYCVALSVWVLHLPL